jgi:SH3-like domain-containing protein
MPRKIIFLTLVWLSLLVAPGWSKNMSIGKDLVNVRSKPDLQAEVIFQASLGYPIEVEKQKNNWLYFRDWKNNAGWVYKPLVSGTKTAVVLVETANVRKGPGLRNPVVMQASKGEIYKVFAEQGNWIKIGYYLENEVIGWVREDLIWGD